MELILARKAGIALTKKMMTSRSPAIVVPEEVHPNAAEVYYDGADRDCDGQDDFDADGDVFLSRVLIVMEMQL